MSSPSVPRLTAFTKRRLQAISDAVSQSWQIISTWPTTTDVYEGLSHVGFSRSDQRQKLIALIVQLEAEKQRLRLFDFYTLEQAASVVLGLIWAQSLEDAGFDPALAKDFVPEVTDRVMPDIDIKPGADHKTPIFPRGLSADEMMRQWLVYHQYSKSLEPERRRGRPRGSAKPKESGRRGLPDEAAFEAEETDTLEWARKWRPDIALETEKGQHKARSAHGYYREKAARLRHQSGS